ncbi:hemerythrin domain-containing protein [Catellatospora sichuanensis]|uniref:hemerythrin domain-containing protein n=1 Tax=Catellatospora sichuanensis TaxID=1969805 RepID=UPI0011834316|nr:hemerythrin domain-containing protein [Catellatospora sichuanensis]
MTDVITLIEQDHRALEELFERLQSGSADRELLFQQMAAMLTAHSRAEEAEVYPAIAKAGEQDEVDHAREEHAQADELVAQLKTMDPESAEFGEVLARLIDAVNEHVAEEESTTLPALRDSVDGERLEQLAESFLARRGQELENGPSPQQVDPDTGQGSGEQTKAELLKQAAERDLPGRSQMTKDELREALKTVGE